MRNLRLIRAGTLAIAGVLAGASVAYADTVPGRRRPRRVRPADVGPRRDVPRRRGRPGPGRCHAHLRGDRARERGRHHHRLARDGDRPARRDRHRDPDDDRAGARGSGPTTASRCSSPAQVLASNGPSLVTLTMPTTPGLNQAFTLLYSRTGATDLTDLTLVTLRVDVIVNTPPVLALPAAMTVEGTTTGGANVSYDAAATDLEDDPDPIPTCSPASGSFFPLGTTTVDCDVADAHGATDSRLVRRDGRRHDGPGRLGAIGRHRRHDGATRTARSSPSTRRPSRTSSTRTQPSPACPASGSLFPVGSTTVTCSATDASGNSASTSFRVDVTYDPGIEWSVAWGEPVGGIAGRARRQPAVARSRSRSRSSPTASSSRPARPRSGSTPAAGTRQRPCRSSGGAAAGPPTSTRAPSGPVATS